jgi:hypothetical protein
MCGSVLLLVARPFRTSLAPVPEAVEHVGARRVPGPLEDLGRETTDRDTLKPVDGTGARNAVANRSGRARRGALNGTLSVSGSSTTSGETRGLITSTRTGHVVITNGILTAPAVPQMRASPAVPARRSLGTKRRRPPRRDRPAHRSYI